MASPLELLDKLERFGIRLGLESTRRLLARLGSPQNELATVLIAGTNGKGSTACLLSSIATAAGYRTGLYTSPHLESVHERVRVDGRAISDGQLSEALAAVISAAEELGEGSATYFEVLTAAALAHFARQGVELAVLEVGLGGRLDATNATEPVLSLITEIGLDHQAHLGATLGEIALEKAGIMRASKTTLAWVSAPEARAALVERARQLGARLRFAIDECTLGAADGGAIALDCGRGRHRLSPPLAGAHQSANLALAVAGAEALGSAGWTRIGPGAIRSGVAGSRWPGRLEWVDLGAAGRALIDGAHNPLGAAALAGYLQGQPAGYTLLFGALDDKRVEQMLPPLAARAARSVLTAPSSPRAIDPAELALLVPERDSVVIADPQAALARALELGDPIVVCGSLYLAGEIRRTLTRLFGVPVPAAAVPTYDPTPTAASSDG